MLSIAAALLLLPGAPAPDVSGKYLAIVATERSEAAARAHLQRTSAAFVVRTDDYPGLKPHLFVVVASAHDDAPSAEARCQDLRRKGTDCYVRRAGARVAKDEPGLAAEKQAAIAAGGPRAAVDFAGRIGSAAGPLAVVVVSRPLSTARHPWTANDSDYTTSVFVFAGERRIRIEDHDLLKPGERVWEEVHCGAPRLFSLGKPGLLPAALAQQCNEEGDSQYRFVILDDPMPAATAKGVATWSSSLYPDAKHERFVPNDDPEFASGLSKRRGDGKTVVEGSEGKQLAAGRFRVRDFAVEWSGGKLERRAGRWRDDGGR